MQKAGYEVIISHQKLVAADAGMPVEPIFGLMRAFGILLTARDNKRIAGSTILSTCRPVIPSYTGNTTHG